MAKEVLLFPVHRLTNWTCLYRSLFNELGENGRVPYMLWQVVEAKVNSQQEEDKHRMSSPGKSQGGVKMRWHQAWKNSSTIQLPFVGPRSCCIAWLFDYAAVCSQKPGDSGPPTYKTLAPNEGLSFYITVLLLCCFSTLFQWDCHENWWLLI